MPVLPAPRGVAGGQCQEMWQEEERSNNKGCRSPPICSVLMSEPRSSWTRRDPQCVTAMRVCVCVSIWPFAANWTKFIMAWWYERQLKTVIECETFSQLVLTNLKTANTLLWVCSQHCNCNFFTVLFTTRLWFHSVCTCLWMSDTQ